MVAINSFFLLGMLSALVSAFPVLGGDRGNLASLLNKDTPCHSLEATALRKKSTSASVKSRRGVLSAQKRNFTWTSALTSASFMFQRGRADFECVSERKEGSHVLVFAFLS